MPRRHSRYIIPLKAIAMCTKCGDCFSWLPPNFDMVHRFRRETHQLCHGIIERQDPKIQKVMERLCSVSNGERGA